MYALPMDFTTGSQQTRENRPFPLKLTSPVPHYIALPHCYMISFEVCHVRKNGAINI